MTSETVNKTPRIGEGKAGPGRPKGCANKVTGILKDSILQAAANAGNGDIVAYLTAQAIANPGPFLALLGKVLPMTLAGDPDNPFEVITRIELVAPRANANPAD